MHRGGHVRMDAETGVKHHGSTQAERGGKPPPQSLQRERSPT